VIELRGHDVLLRGLVPGEVDEVLARIAPAEIAAGDKAAVARKRARLERSGERTGWEIWFAIEVGGRLVGDVQGRCSEIVMPPGVWELGIELWGEADRGRGYGREACALLTSHLFEAEDAIRVQATTDLDNAAMRRTLETLGFGYEGVLRGFMPQADDEPRDYAIYAMTRRDHQAERNPPAFRVERS
jgi:RimJ/RimL family protein N-acetyltransferase